MTSASSAKNQRCQVTLDEIEGLRITIPVEIGCAEVGTLLVGFMVWGLLEFISLFYLIEVMQAARRSGQANILAPLLFLLAWSAAGVVYLLWVVPWGGRSQSVVIDGDHLMIRRSVGSDRSGSSYSLAGMRNLRYSPDPEFATPWRVYHARLETPENIAFDYNGATIRFAPGLDETECRRLIRTIKDRYKIPDDQDEPLSIERL